MIFKYLDFVVTGCPRSGTQYVARVLKKLGYDCDHEVCFNPWQITSAEERDESQLWGDSSWMAVPFLGWLPAETAVIHVVRDPVRTINSMLGTGQFDWPTDYRRFLFHHFRGDADYWPDDICAAAQEFWIGWNERIDRTERVRMCIQIERFGGSLAELVDLLEPGRKLSALDIARVAEVPLNENTRPYEGTNAIDGSELTMGCRELARKYGYAGRSVLPA